MPVTGPGRVRRVGGPGPDYLARGTRMGACAAGMIVREEYGYRSAVKNNELVKVPREEVAGKLKTVDPKCPMIAEAKAIGICFGDK